MSASYRVVEVESSHAPLAQSPPSPFVELAFEFEIEIALVSRGGSGDRYG
ncbi:MAG: hypothetical protein K8U03_22385 [Planctomycetia bacterium]|nr:hypothetical protein [Planctomycetia bacterium]